MKYTTRLLIVFDACARWTDDGHSQWRFTLIRRRRLRIPNLEKLFVARRIEVKKYSPMPNVRVSSFSAFK